jgi:hypothetical protein
MGCRLARRKREAMMEPTHRDLAADAWWGLSLAEQLGNIGSEISRAERWKTRNPEISRAAFFRALQLLDLTLADPRLRESRPRLREVARAREVVADYFGGRNQYASTGPSLQKYFDAFVLLSRQRQPAR